MQYLNVELKIIHRDLKAANIFLVAIDKKLEVRIGDFGHALNTITNLDPNYFHIGTVGWMVIGIQNKKFYMLDWIFYY